MNQTDNLTFTCVAFGIPTPDIMWSRASDPSNFFMNETDSIAITKVVSGYNITSTFTIYDAKRTDMDMYICTGNNNITNVINSTEATSVSLFVQGMSMSVHSVSPHYFIKLLSTIEPVDFLVDPVNTVNYTVPCQYSHYLLSVLDSSEVSNGRSVALTDGDVVLEPDYSGQWNA